MTPPTPDQAEVSALGDEELVDLYRSIKSDLGNGSPGVGRDPLGGSDVEDEMKRRGLMPDREDIIPDEPESLEDLDLPSGSVEDLPPGPGSASGEDGDDDLTE